MKFDNPVPVTTIAQLIGAEVSGNTHEMVTGINEIHKVEKGDLVFVDHPKYYGTCLNSAATFIIINKKIDCPENKTLLIVDEPFEAYLKIINFYRPFTPSMKWISDTAFLGEGTIVMPGVYIGDEVHIGKNCVIHPHVTILDHCLIGDDVIIQSGTVIGSDAFYYNKKTNRDIHYKKMTSCGRVLIENAVEIGANCSIDRGVSHDTVIGAGTKMDNLIHIGHDTVIGKNCLFAGQVGIAGGTTIEDNVILWGQVGVSKTLTIGKDAVVYAQSGVKDSIAGGKVYFGSPVEEAKEKMKEFVWIKRIPLLWEKVMGKKV
ncbi:MAG: UDP-3-O-(3-hydroxymyristoyl)glucosamine N-acyltransferase [Chitinophagaceae bacterium]|nr:UDP-3-O-(3-hydroxymyristoyl)glucosamine N-acyltransferase [Chitinophagaceae bacterium]MBK9569476.1 UDP-3-O-(3-hydroxymyristoyl)glucosamine N-acyltransferase [Chitinophagaceae bacterium]MBL0132398.1 UDP-3-O-(3-hydroxymyristoyl)glucosamine N-acyltransferase [Chitinophagaceae bacterium]MBL0271576.1 UDP-3-O-(3-hydroxymyristoyl)glucosamine N-acyltransferase [Chitinophagaceae bacterium]